MARWATTTHENGVQRRGPFRRSGFVAIVRTAGIEVGFSVVLVSLQHSLILGTFEAPPTVATARRGREHEEQTLRFSLCPPGF